MKTKTNNLKEQEVKLVECWQYYNKCLAITNNSECDEQEFIELGKAANQWRLQSEIVDQIKRDMLCL